ncbi:MAG: helix-turn-helix domain-containing protein, partial [Gammaproteobacteria bacterium]
MDTPSQIRLRRLRLGLTLREVASAIGTDPSALSWMERGLARHSLRERAVKFLKAQERLLPRK